MEIIKPYSNALKENHYIYRIGLIVTIVLIVFNINQANAQSYGSFPYKQNFTSGTQPAEVILPTGSGTNAATFTTTGLQLTPAVNNRFGAIIIDNKTFDSSLGIKISFEYAIHGGTGADGLSVFLFDASITPSIGASGRGLGYGYIRARDLYASRRDVGLAGAYLGIALDAFGNFKNNVFQGDARVNGIPAPSGGWSNANSHVTLRGARGGFLDANGKAAGYTGYPVLITQGTLTPLSSANGSATLNTLGGYTYGGGTSSNFNLRSGTYTTDPNNAAYRKAFIDLTPNVSGGFNITVKIQHQNTITTVVDNYWYKTSVLYTENANPQVTDFNSSDTQGANTTHTLNTVVPTNFKIGFAASTGGLNDIHQIWGLEVVLPNAAVASNDNASTCKNSTVIIDPYTNDIAYAGPTTGTPTSSSSNIDLAQFRFLNADGTTASNPFLVSNSQGTFSYNSTTGKVSFLPSPGFSGIASIQYNIKGKTYPAGTFQPYGDEAFRSGAATISVVVNKCQIISNPMLPFKSNQKS